MSTAPLRTPCCNAMLNWDEQYDQDGNVTEIHLRCIICSNEWDGAGDPR